MQGHNCSFVIVKLYGRVNYEKQHFRKLCVTAYNIIGNDISAKFIKLLLHEYLVKKSDL